MIFDQDVEALRRIEKRHAPEKFFADCRQRPATLHLCKRCTRVCDEWMGEDAIEAGNRGVNTAGTFMAAGSIVRKSGNCIEVCPTLLDGTFRHGACTLELNNADFDWTHTRQTVCNQHRRARGDFCSSNCCPRPYVDGLNGEFLWT